MASGKWARGKERRPELATTQWRKLSLAIRAAEPLCRPCSKAGRIVLAVQVDHIDEDHPDFYDPANLQPICAQCNAEKEIRRKGYRVKQQIDPKTGYPRA